VRTLVLSGNFPLELAKGSFGELDNCVPKNLSRTLALIGKLISVVAGLDFC
jgi:hypothetical protein